MAQQTLVLRVPATEEAALRARLGGGNFEYRTVPHAILSVKGEGVVATLYRSGKLVIQGDAPELFAERFVEGGAARRASSQARRSAQSEAQSETQSKARGLFDRPTVGSDESGKGDYFGPLVCAAVRLEPSQAETLSDAGVMDSKRVGDARALRLGAWLRESTDHAIRSLEPEAYNRAWKERGLHALLSELHATVLRAVARRGDRAVVDRFARRDAIGPALVDLDLDLELRPRAESELAVAAASILARAEFLVRLKELGEECGVALPKGAGAGVDVAGAALVRAHGEEALARVAKMHFKNTAKVRELL